MKHTLLNYKLDLMCNCILMLRHTKLNATSVKSLSMRSQVDVLEEYHPFLNVLNPHRASELLPHRPWDCAIDLLSGSPTPRG